MKTIVSIVLVFAALISAPVFAQGWQCDYYIPQCPDKLKEFDKAAMEIAKPSSGREPTLIDASEKFIVLVQKMYPKDKTLNDMAKQRYVLAKFSAASNLSKDEKINLIEVNSTLLQDIINDRFEMANAFMDADREYQKQQQSRSSAGNTAAVATMLNGIGKAFTNSFGQSLTPPPRICNYYSGTSYCF